MSHLGYQPPDYDEDPVDFPSDEVDSNGVLMRPAVADVDQVPFEERRLQHVFQMRQNLLRYAFALVFALIGLAAITIFWGNDSQWGRVSDLLNALIPVSTLILGAVVAYYFKTDGDL